MKTGRLNRAESGVMRGRTTGVALLVAVALLSCSCRRQTPPPPPPEPPPAAAPPPAPAPTIQLSASQTSITAGQSTTLQWTSTNASTVSIEPGIGTVATSGMRAVSPTSSVTYNATATGPGGTASSPLRITVNAAPAPAPPPAAAPPALSIDELMRQNMQTILFDFDRADIRADQAAKVQAAARFLQQNATLQVTISGHADERGSQEYNIGLGDRRANAVRQALIQQGVAANRLNTVSYGEERPVCTVSNENCWQQNRRAEYARR
jgi:peptidoglycan-associated lipoprotein